VKRSGHVEPPFLEGAADSRRLVWLGDRPAPDPYRTSSSSPSWTDSCWRIAVRAIGASSPVGEIHGFYSNPAAWGTGAATLLMTEACSILATTWRDVVLWTMQEAHRARSFYEKVGFRLTGAEKREKLSNWLTGETVEQTAVQYGKPL
jgi:GNAT superfamily N-acetyltransferase